MQNIVMPANRAAELHAYIQSEIVLLKEFKMSQAEQLINTSSHTYRYECFIHAYTLYIYVYTCTTVYTFVYILGKCIANQEPFKNTTKMAAK